MSESTHLKKPIIILAGPTAIGKTELSLQIAAKFNGEIIGVDSMQVYKYMDIGSAKPTAEERGRVRHHLIDYIEPDAEYNASIFASDCKLAMNEIYAAGKIPLLAGGTGMYIKCLLEGIFDMPEIPIEIRQDLRAQIKDDRNYVVRKLAEIDPISAKRIHPNDTQRLTRALEIFYSTGKTWSSLLKTHASQRALNRAQFTERLIFIGLERPREELYERINRRVGLMVEIGLMEEVQGLLDRGFAPELKSMQSLGYRHMVNYLSGIWDLDKSLQLLARDTRRYAKRQITWFKTESDISWFSPEQSNDIFEHINGNL